MSSTIEPLKSATVRDGTQIAYKVITGKGSGRIALIHSLALDHSFWNRTAALLEAAGDVLVFDCRGHGRSSRGGGRFTGELFARDLADLLDIVGWDKTAVAGASMGGCAALAFAAAHPDRLSGLGLVDTTAWYGEDAPEQWEERAQKAFKAGLETLVSFQKARWFSKEFSEANPDIVSELVDIFLANDIADYMQTCRMLGRFNKTDALGAITAPTRILVGSEDLATPLAMAETMKAAIPHAELTILNGAAHLTPVERPVEVAEALRALMSRA
jgi:3-oxoadipate enol-lactonase